MRAHRDKLLLHSKRFSVFYIVQMWVYRLHIQNECERSLLVSVSEWIQYNLRSVFNVQCMRSSIHEQEQRGGTARNEYTHRRTHAHASDQRHRIRQTKCISVGVQHSAITHTFHFMGFLHSFRWNTHSVCVCVVCISFCYWIKYCSHREEAYCGVRVRVRKGKVQSFFVTIEKRKKNFRTK